MARSISQLYRTAFVTGAASGLGRAFAEMLAEEGVKVWASSRDPARLAELAARHPGRIFPVELELRRPAAAAAAWRAAAGGGGGIDLLVNNAGFGIFGEFASVRSEDWEAQISAMLGTSLRLAREAWSGWGAGRPGCLVNVSSLAVEFPLPFMAGYNAAKAGLSALSESLMLEARGTGIVVIDFRPGDYPTDFNRAMRRPGAGSAAETAAWAALERNLAAGPPPARAAADLRRALLRRRSGTVRTGSWFQARLAPGLARFLPAAALRAACARYFGLP